MTDMKILMTAVLILASLPAFARPTWQENRMRQKASDEVILAAIDEIPLYSEKLEGQYDILAVVRGQDMLNKKKSSIYYQMRETAYKINADAVMQVTCSRVLKSTFQSCEGFAIKYKK